MKPRANNVSPGSIFQMVAAGIVRLGNIKTSLVRIAANPAMAAKWISIKPRAQSVRLGNICQVVTAGIVQGAIIKAPPVRIAANPVMAAK